MKILTPFLNKLIRLEALPFFVIFLGLLISGSVSYLISPKSAVLPAPTPTEIQQVQPTETVSGRNEAITVPAEPVKKTVQAVPSPTAIAKVAVSSPSTGPVQSPVSSPKNTQIAESTKPSSTPIPVNTASVTPSVTPSPSVDPSVTPVPSPVQSVATLSIKSPSGDSSFQISVSGNMNVCDLLQKARDEGKISSLTFDDSYLSAFNSRYVIELNGLRNNWTFKVNGQSPLGCSLITVSPNDQIVWEYQ